MGDLRVYDLGIWAGRLGLPLQMSVIGVSDLAAPKAGSFSASQMVLSSV